MGIFCKYRVEIGLVRTLRVTQKRLVYKRATGSDRIQLAGKKKILFYAAVVRPQGKVITLQVKRFNQKNTAKFIYKIRDQFPGYRIDLVCDNALWHNGKHIRKALSKTRIHEHPLPPYGPQMNASEYFIRWVKEVLSYNFCWKDVDSLKYSFRGFVASLSRKAKEVIQRCKPKMFGFSIV